MNFDLTQNLDIKRITSAKCSFISPKAPAIDYGKGGGGKSSFTPIKGAGQVLR